LAISCSRPSTSEQIHQILLEGLERRVIWLDIQNDIDKKNLNRLYMDFEIARVTGFEGVDSVYDKAMRLRTMSDALFEEIQNQKDQETVDSLPLPSDLFKQFEAYQEFVFKLTTFSIPRMELRLDYYSEVPNQTWSRDKVITNLDLSFKPD
jgi:hypothetical protein